MLTVASVPPAPTAPRRQVFVATAVVCAGALALVGGLLALWLSMRTKAIDAGNTWMPKGIKVPMVPANTLLLVLIPLCIFAQWAVYSATRGDKPHTGTALGLVGLMGLAFINAQAFVYSQMKLPVNEGTYSALFYTVTGVVLALALVGVVFTGVTAFRYLGGRTADRETVVSLALYWYAFSAVFAAVWFVVYVTK